MNFAPIGGRVRSRNLSRGRATRRALCLAPARWIGCQRIIRSIKWLPAPVYALRERHGTREHKLTIHDRGSRGVVGTAISPHARGLSRILFVRIFAATLEALGLPLQDRLPLRLSRL